MAHTLTFYQDNFGYNCASVQERDSDKKEWIVVHRDNQHVIVDTVYDTDRRVYKVREWLYTGKQLQCRATRME